ncbi:MULTISPECIES: YafY family protein [Roseobacteraceae]|uniref:helix-turn-helix transcriptional regulator n=1 Tax=Roseobacteraceae TaxID=2854170 RepID=UPI0018D83ECC|nr:MULTISPECIES: WYL domain-containing protein [Roseobacteraceae]MDE4176062.1 WYL domain-containing protein [Phaeobacter sp. PT47_59]
MRLFRLFRLLDVMRLRSTPVTAASLAVDLGISVRSIYRDIADLQAMGAPIRGEGGLGYVMERGYFLPSLRFEADELDAIILGLKLVHERAAPVLDGAAVRAAAKISSVLGEGQKDSMIDPALEAGPSRTMYGDGNSATYATLRAAISAREFLTIGYRNSEGRLSTREARPLGLTLFENAWLLTIWSEAAQDFRHLRLDRISSVITTGKRFRLERGKRFKDAIDIERGKIALQTPVS